MSSFKEAVQLLCKSDHPDDLIKSSKYLCHLANVEGDTVKQVLRTMVLPRLVDILKNPPAQRQADAENWPVFWVLRGLGEVCSLCGLEQVCTRFGGLHAVLKWIDPQGQPETTCVALKTLTVLSAGCSSSLAGQDSIIGGGGDDDDQGHVIDDMQLKEEYEQAVAKTLKCVQEQARLKRMSRHPFVLPLGAYALAYLISNRPESGTAIDLEAVCHLFDVLAEEGDPDVAEPLLIATDAFMQHSTETRKLAITSGLVRKVLWRIGRQDYNILDGGTNGPAMSLLMTIVEKVPDGVSILLREANGMRALSTVLSSLKDPKDQLRALKVANALIDHYADVNEAVDVIIADGMFVEIFLLLTEAADFEVKREALCLLEKCIRQSSPASYNKMQIDVYFVLSLLALAKSSPDPEKVKFGRQITGLVMWLSREGRIDLSVVTGVGAYATAARIVNGTMAISLAGTIYKRLKEESEKKEKLRKLVESKSAKSGDDQATIQTKEQVSA